jgi:protein SHQ1
LVDIVFAWAYDHRTTYGEHTIESAWTVGTISATLAFLTEQESVRKCVVGSFRRALCYPLVRSWEVLQLVLQDVKAIFAMGKRALLRCLLDCHTIFQKDEVKYLLNEIYITDYCVRCTSIPPLILTAIPHVP